MSGIHSNTVRKEAKSDFPDWAWLTILVQPRSTIRAIVESDQHRHVYALVILSGIASMLSEAIGRSLGDDIPLPYILIGAVLLSPLAIIGWSISGAVLGWTGRLFGGRASNDNVRAVLAWTAVPTILSLIFLLPSLLIYGSEMFTTYTPLIDNNPLPFILYGFTAGLLLFWHYIIYWKCYAEVHELSLVKAFVAAILPMLLLLGPAVCAFLMAEYA